MSNLLVITSAPGDTEGDTLILDKKFVEGMKYYSDAWDDRTTCLIRKSSQKLPFSDRFDATTLPFDVQLRPAGYHIEAKDLADYDIILCSGDNAEYLHISKLSRNLQKKFYYIIEYIPETRRQIVMLERGRSLPRKLKAIVNIHLTERRRRSAFAIASGLQANGYPAAELYKPINPNTILYLDNRIDSELFVTDAEMTAKYGHQAEGRTLRLIHSGRLEPLKGSQDLVPIARHLRDSGVDFRLDIFGKGSLEGEIAEGIKNNNLADQVKLHGSVDFASELVPYGRTYGDIFLSCNRQSDPSCSYLENMGCGLAIAGYDNRMWSALFRESKAGWIAPLGDWKALADQLVRVANDRKSLTNACKAAQNFASKHLFEDEFGKRIAQLKNGISS